MLINMSECIVKKIFLLNYYYYHSSYYSADAKTLLGISRDVGLEPLVITEESDITLPAPARSRHPKQLPLYETVGDNDDNVDHVSNKSTIHVEIQYFSDG